MNISTTKPNYRNPYLSKLSRIESNLTVMEGMEKVSQYKVTESKTVLGITVPYEPISLRRAVYSYGIAQNYFVTLIISEVPTSDIELNPANSSEVNIPHSLESISEDLKLLHKPEENIAESEEADEIEIDYSEMELRARVKIPAGVNWEKAFSGAKTYSDVFNFQYDLDSED